MVGIIIKDYIFALFHKLVLQCEISVKRVVKHAEKKHGKVDNIYIGGYEILEFYVVITTLGFASCYLIALTKNTRNSLHLYMYM